MSDNGVFPFGRPNDERPARRVAGASATVIGVYPSAWHVTWTAPPALFDDGNAHAVKALAVDVEPTVFWDGASDDFEARLRAWKEKVGFIEGAHGTISQRSPSTNGSSGSKVVTHYLAPLGLAADRTAFTDVYPVFLVKSGGGSSRREQGDAIREEYDSIAERMGKARCTLPARIPSGELPTRAAHRFGARLTADLEAAAAPLVITLGREVWDTLLLLPALGARPPCARFDDLKSARYGERGSLQVGGCSVEWLALVHPGLLKGEASDWAERHATWRERQR
jgi:hypothetical protein